MKDTSKKVFGDVSELATVLNLRRQHGEEIVFTNGCFDLIHTGHTRYLQQARNAGDCLVIGVNSDESVVRLKGDKRPIITLQERLEVLAGLEFVDYVIPFGEDDPLKLISALQPTVLVKGGDWPLDKIIGKDVVEGSGGKVFTVPEIQGQSTSNIIKRIADRYS